MPVVQPVLETVTNSPIYMLIVGKSVPIDKYEQYKRVINQIIGRLYIDTHTYIHTERERETETETETETERESKTSVFVCFVFCF